MFHIVEFHNGILRAIVSMVRMSKAILKMSSTDLSEAILRFGPSATT